MCFNFFFLKLQLNLVGGLTFPLSVIYRKGNFVYHHKGCTSIYRPLSYPFRFLYKIFFKSFIFKSFARYLRCTSHLMTARATRCSSASHTTPPATLRPRVSTCSTSSSAAPARSLTSARLNTPWRMMSKRFRQSNVYH